MVARPQFLSKYSNFFCKHSGIGHYILWQINGSLQRMLVYLGCPTHHLLPQPVGVLDQLATTGWSLSLMSRSGDVLAFHTIVDVVEDDAIQHVPLESSNVQFLFHPRRGDRLCDHSTSCRRTNRCRHLLVDAAILVDKVVDVVEDEQLVLGEVEDLVVRSRGVSHQLHVDNRCHESVDGDRPVVTYPGRSIGRRRKKLVVLHGLVNVPLPVLLSPLVVQVVGVRHLHSVAVLLLDVLAELKMLKLAVLKMSQAQLNLGNLGAPGQE